ncbi:MAG: sulfatase [Bryobacterales bacterium]|nr:sulfatase [Bryobacterales bacterium]
MQRRNFLATLAGAPAFLRGQTRRPNILFVMTDDQRHDAMSCAGNRWLKTPHMDRLAAEGVRFTEGFVTNALCTPSRATVLTGQYSHTHGVTSNARGSNAFRPDQVTFPMLLQKAGYFTAVVGKWHIASNPTGFDQWCILPGQGLYHNPVMIANGGRVQMRGHCEDVVGDQALETLKSRPKDKPFCLLYQFKAPHRAWEPSERHARLYEDVTFPHPPTFDVGLDDRPRAIRESDMQIADMPDFAQRGVPAHLSREERKKLNYQVFLRNYYRVLNGVDENLGRVLDYLDQNGLAENTLVIYTSDNGFFHGEYGMFDKRFMYEPSIRVPMLVRYPGAVQPRVDSRHMVLNNDVAHTVLDYAGVARPEWMEHHGASWRPLLEGRSAPWRDAWMYEYFEYPAVHCAGKMRGVRTDRWKLIHYIQNPQGHELFDLQTDPEERRNLYDVPEHRAKAAEMQARLERFRDLLKDDRSEDGAPMQECGNRMAPLRR